jgi:polyphosphate:AMP phosphotransferase
MFETAELGHKVTKEEYQERVLVLRQRLLRAGNRLLKADFPVIVVFAGVDGAGKSESANLLTAWMDPRRVVTHAYSVPTQEELERPTFWRYWLALPPKGHIGLFLSAWYSSPLLQRVYGETTQAQLDDRLDRIAAFERTLANDGALIVKFWMHLGRKAQRKRLKSLEADPHLSWRVTKRDWKHWRMYDRFIPVAEHVIMRTSTGRAPWTIVEGYDARYRSLKVGSVLLEALQARLARMETETETRTHLAAPAQLPPSDRIDVTEGPDHQPVPVTILSRLDTGLTLPKPEYVERLARAQGRLNELFRRLAAQGRSMALVFQGWDAAGKGGAIRRLTAALDARDYEVVPVGAPTDEERAHHYLWRFWRHLPRGGRLIVFDRSWYGRVLVERVEGFATEDEWRRAYAEINDFEQQIVEHGDVLAKFWIHITYEEQARRFEERERLAHKRWKLTQEDWRNRARWSDYELAVNDMIEHTSTGIAPWTLVEGNDKRYARVKVIEATCEHLARALCGDEA